MPNVIVIGASRGIGRELATRYAGDGWQVLATVRKADDAAQFDGVAGVTTAIADTGDGVSLAGLPGFAADLPSSMPASDRRSRASPRSIPPTGRAS